MRSCLDLGVNAAVAGTGIRCEINFAYFILGGAGEGNIGGEGEAGTDEGSLPPHTVGVYD